MGATGPAIEKALEKQPCYPSPELQVLHAATLEEAVALARGAARPGDEVLFSPASASFDLYPNFEVRGQHFKSIVNSLT